MIVSIKCSCGNEDPGKAREYSGAMGYEAVICLACGRIHDHEGEHLPEPAYTPGPWHVSADGHAGGNVFRFNVSGPHFTPEEKAQAVNDARLIAKAPELLALVARAANFFEMNGADRVALVEDCKAAIAKAEGK